MYANNTLPISRVKELLDYDPETGAFSRCVQIGKGRKPGPIKAAVSGNSYVQIWLDGKSFRAQRLAVAIVTGEWPAGHVDHINGDKTDNRIANLRVASNAENMRNVGQNKNNTTGYRGVSFHKKAGKFAASITVNGKSLHLGLFLSAELAHEAYKLAAKAHFGEFRHSTFGGR